MQPDPLTKKYRETPTLPACLALTEAERDEIACHVKELEALVKQTPAERDEFVKLTFDLIGMLMMNFNMATQNEVSAQVRVEFYMDTLGDVPWWATASAVKRFAKGEAGLNERGEPYSTHWCPTSAEVRAVALQECWRIGHRIKVLTDLVRAEPRIEFSDEHCAEMRAKLASLVRFQSTPLVGSDGSGGAVGHQPMKSATVGPDQAQARP
jgi:hypothetical protein